MTATPSRINHTLSLVLFAFATAAFTWCGFTLAESWLFQSRQEAVLAAQIEAGQIEAGPVASDLPVAAVVPGGVIGRVSVERLGISVMVVEGVSNAALRRAAGHIPGTALPGQPGNTAISAHRDTFFRPLRNIRQDDLITVTTPATEFRYRVVSIRIVSPETVSVLDPSVNQVLTLVTCYPFYFVGPASDRFIVRAERI